ncbi:cell division protein ZapA [Caenimonas soli]|uniref:cell division protein ZapA n=1 Tax=Caenimonas soli TaxID=2735555 RepID=UPI00155394B0|nr:cell division protein ZapA [Caenimonas soli]NPC57557.1 cell division protein ZapA [Caenimonas soli]
MKQVEVQIMGQSYLLGCPDGGQQRLLEAVEKVDTAMCKIRDAGKVKARDRIAVLAALNLAFDVSDRNTSALHASGFAQSEFPTDGNGYDANDPRLAGLVNRLDDALGDDGRLL